MSIPITAAELAMDKSQLDQREKLLQSVSVITGPIALRRYAAFKAHVTRGIRNGTAMAALYRQRFADQETTTLDQLVEIRDMIRKIVHHVECCHICVSRARDCLTDAPPQADVDALNQRDIDIDAEATTVLKELTALRDTIVQNLTRNAQAQAHNNAAMINPNQAVIDAINRPHSGQALKPKTLNRDFSPVQFDYWKDRVKAYFLASGYTAQPMQLQQQYIFALIEPTLLSSIRVFIDSQTPVLPHAEQECILDILDKEFLQKYPLFDRRYDLLRLKPRGNQKLSEYVCDFFKSADDAKVSEMSADNWVTLTILSTVTDPRLLRKLLKDKNMTKRDLLQAIDEFEQIESTTTKLAPRGFNSVNSLSVRRSSAAPRSLHRRAPSARRPATVAWAQQTRRPNGGRSNDCYNCGQSRRQGQQHTCPARDSVCRRCSKRGHFSSVCLSSGQRPRSGQNQFRRGRSQSAGRSGNRFNSRGRSPGPKRRFQSKSPGRFGRRTRSQSYTRASAVEVADSTTADKPAIKRPATVVATL